MGLNIKKIFLPSVGVDIVFNMNSLAPYSRSSIIYDVNFSDQSITIAQPLIPISKSTAFKELHLTTILQDKNRKFRAGVAIHRFSSIDDYRLANKTSVPAVLLNYELPVKETNIRSAFRLPLSTKYIIKGKLLHNNLEYQTSRDFSIRDISLTGLGLLVPQKRGDHVNPLSKLAINEKLTIGVILIDMTLDKPIGTLSIKAQISRTNPKYSESHALLGLKISPLAPKNESLLNKFIHDAQIDELKRLSGRNL